MEKYLAYIIAIFAFFSCQKQENAMSSQPQQKDIIESVYASIEIMPAVSYYPQSIHSGIIDKVYIKDGDLVKKGQELFQVAPASRFEGQLANANINLEEAKLNYLGQNSLLNNIKLEIQTTKEKLGLDSINFQRYERLNAQDIGKKADYDQAKLQYQHTQNQLKILQQQLVQTQSRLESNYKKALNTISTEKKQLADFTIQSKMDGKVYFVNKEEGDFIGMQEPLAEIGSHEQFKIEMDIDEVDITKIDIGDSVLITLNAYPAEVFLATISKILPKKREVTQTFKVEGIFKNAPEKLYYGLSGEGNIVVAKRKKALVIPSEYLIADDKVLTTEGERQVKVGIKNLEFVEIISGIDTTATLIKLNE